jgi:hypothetical protein
MSPNLEKGMHETRTQQPVGNAGWMEQGDREKVPHLLTPVGRNWVHAALHPFTLSGTEVPVPASAGTKCPWVEL